MAVKYQVFISSTYEDLKKEREQVIKATLEMGHIPVGMEMFSAGDEEQWKLITRQIDESDYYVVIVAHRYGSVDGGISYTEKEYDYAVQQGVPILAFVIDEKAPWPADRMENDEGKRERLEGFKEKSKKKPIGYWKSTEDLYGKFSIALMKSITTNPRPGWVKTSEVAGVEEMMELSRLSGENAALRMQLESARKKTEGDIIAEREKILGVLKQNKIEIKLWYLNGKGWSEPIEEDMYVVFDLLAPELLIEKSHEAVAWYLGLMMNPEKGEKKVRKRWPVPSNSVKIWLCDLMALGLVMPSKRKHPVSDKNEYWTLTEEGKILYNDLRRLELYRKPDARLWMKTAEGEKRKGIRESKKRKRV